MSDYYEPELGELVFGAAWSEYELDDGWISEELCELSELLITKEWEGAFAKTITLEQALWEVGYGIEFKNSVFEMNSYWWGDCTCGYEELEDGWREIHHHDSECPKVKGWKYDCDCGYVDEWREWSMENHHDPDCMVVRPNFKHYDSGVEIRWYKYIGRGMSVSESGITRDEWRKIFQECRDSLK